MNKLEYNYNRKKEKVDSVASLVVADPTLANFPTDTDTRPISHSKQNLSFGSFLTRQDPHLRFKQAQPKMCHSQKVEDGVENHF